MRIDKILSTLNSATRREVLRIIAMEPKNVKEVFAALTQRGLKLKYRESVYKALQNLVDSGLVDKSYKENKGICYRLLVRKIELDLVEETVTMVK